ncbi:NUDIX hydrolase [Deinococcus planocerae]|uniref:NUDIX hydrolase n=1 Tax=Deinococcus planocerae TaxID=1737569 RepID=UPI000C7F7558|nr:NUDIX domain-containing protein [Deinococcus planocerae]
MRETVREETTWEGRPVRLTWLPGYRPRSHETVTQVSGLCFTAGGQIVLVSRDGRAWSLPGGKPEDGEPWEETLRREVAEEACAEVLDCRFLGAQRVEGLTPQPYSQLRFRARVGLHPFTPTMETQHRTMVSTEEYARVLPWGAGAIGQALLRQALDP